MWRYLMSTKGIIIYKATNIGDNPETGMGYCGFTKFTLEIRKGQHLRSKKQDVFHCAIRQWGPESFSWKTLAVVENKLKEINETNTIAAYKTLNPNGYNSTTGGEGGFERSEVTRKKLSKINKGRKHTKKARQNMSNAHIGKHPTEETLLKMSIAQTGRKQSKKSIEKTRKANLGRKATKEAKHNMSISHIGLQAGEKHPANKYHYFCSDNKNYWTDFAENERIHICQKFARHNSDIIVYKGVTITRVLK